MTNLGRGMPIRSRRLNQWQEIAVVGFSGLVVALVHVPDVSGRAVSAANPSAAGGNLFAAHELRRATLCSCHGFDRLDASGMGCDVLLFLETEGPRLHSLLLRLTLCEHAAEDLMQELFLKLSQSGAFARASHPIAYARRAAINLATDWLRSRKRGPKILALDTEPRVNDLSPLDVLARDERVQRVLEAASELPRRFRDVFVMRYVEQHSYEEIAEQLGKTTSQVRTVCSKALVRMRDRVNRPVSYGVQRG